MSAQPSTKSPVTTVRFAGEELELHAGGALYWPAENMLIVSDLHLEKASFLARFGAAIPQYDTLDTLMRLDALLHHYQPSHVVCLGDSFHDRNAHHRMPEQEHAYLKTLMQRVKAWHWVLGNHDVALANTLEGNVIINYICRTILLSHEPDASPLAQIIGHYHPKARLSLGGRRVNGKCFMLAEKLLIMPAFGSFTGGLDSGHEALTALSPTPFSRYLVYREAIWKI